MALTYREMIGLDEGQLANYIEHIPRLQVSGDTPGAVLLSQARRLLIHQIEEEFTVGDPDTFWPTEAALREIRGELPSLLDTAGIRAATDIPNGWQAFVDLHAWRTEHCSDFDGSPEDLANSVCWGIARELVEALITELIDAILDRRESQTSDPFMHR